MKPDKEIKQAQDVLRIEAESIMSLIDKLDGNFTKAVNIIFKSKGRVIVTGIGKSGLIGKKIVATLTSTGTPAIFLHPVEGMHGDLGIVTKDDVLIAISNSGETSELTIILQSLKKIGAPLIAFTGRKNSTLARASDVVIDVGVEREACPFGLAPTSSTTACLAMGDALAVALIKTRKFGEKDFQKFHPGGNLGQRLMAKVRDAMLTGSQIPKVSSGAKAMAAVKEIDDKNVGFVLVVGKQNLLQGILTDGDVRRLITKGVHLDDKKIEDIMSRSPKTVDENSSLAQAIEFMQQKEITTLAVVNDKNQVKGFIHLHDILGRGGTVKISIA